MKHHEYYKKYKTNYPPPENQLFSKKNWWPNILVVAVVVLIEPLIIMFKHQRLSHFSFPYYLKLIEYLLFIVVPFLAFLIWVHWRDWIRRTRGYGWLGKFEVISKQSSFIFCYLLLAPGDDNKVKVSRDLFEKIRQGDFIEIRRDSLGGIEEINKVKNFPGRLAMGRVKQLSNLPGQSTTSEGQKKQG